MTQRKIIIGVGIVLVLGAAFGVHKMMGGKKEESPGGGGFSMPVEAAKAQADTLRTTVQAVGSLIAQEGITLRPEVSGRITEILFTEGQQVEKGAPLITLDDSTAKAQFDQAQAQQSLAAQNSTRAVALLGRGAGTAQSRDQSDADLRVANASLELARAALDKTHIVAPFAGTIGIRKVSIGDYVSPGQDIVSLQALNPMKLDFTVPETTLATLTVGQKVQLTVSAYQGQNFEGTVSAIDPQIDPSTRSVAIRALVPNADKKLTPGLFASVTLTTAEKPNTVFIPSSSIWPMGDQSFVFKITDGIANMVPVTITQREADRVAIADGDVKGGDLVVTAGQTKLAMGPPHPTPVMVIDPNAKPAETAAPPAAPADAKPDDTKPADAPKAEEAH